MSKLAKVPIVIKEGVTVLRDSDVIKITGPKGTLIFGIPVGVDVKTIDNKLQVFPLELEEDRSAVLGLTRATIANMVTGVTTGFEKKLELSGVGYRATIAGGDLNLSVGFSHPVKVKAQDGIKYSVEENVITVSGIDKTLVGNITAQIRKVKPPEPYKGKGIKYLGEKIRRKAGKAAKAIGTK